MKSVNDLHEAALPEESSPALSLGEYIRMRREAKRIGVDEMARDLKIAPRYVVALEEGAYHIFPAKIYAHGFLNHTLSYLHIAEDQKVACMELFQEEWKAHFPEQEPEPVSLPAHSTYIWLLTPARIMQGLGVLAVGVFLVFLGIQLRHFTGTPRLTLEWPPEGFAVNEPVVQVKGTTEKESQLTVNGREVTIDGAGNFDTLIDLRPGVNMLEFSVRNRFGKETRVTRAGVVR